MALEPEATLERRLRATPPLIPAATFAAGALLYAGIVASALVFDAGHPGVVVISGLLVHAWMLVLVHDGAHRAITGTRLDRVVMNVAAGLVLLPFWAEPFRRAHLIHHATTNTADDPLWPAFKRRLYDEHRALYLLAEAVPLLFSVIGFASLRSPPPTGGRWRGTSRRGSRDAGPRVSLPLLALAWVVAVATAWLLRPSPAFVLATFFVTNLWGTLRHFCEHFGTATDRESNTFRFPLGMGIGNHAVHHARPGWSWLTLALGLRHRPKETGPLRALVGVLGPYRRYAYVEASGGDPRVVGGRVQGALRDGRNTDCALRG
jgi:fatty acid desaturase